MVRPKILSRLSEREILYFTFFYNRLEREESLPGCKILRTETVALSRRFRDFVLRTTLNLLG